MLRRLTVVLAVFACAVGALAGSSSAVTSVDLVYDSGPKYAGAGPSDMVGPRVGWVISKQLFNGNLEINIEVRRADANATYFVEVWCGPTHAAAGALITSGQTVTTNASGAASAQVIVPAASLGICGPGSHNGHIDLQNATTELAATPLEFSVP